MKFPELTSRTRRIAAGLVALSITGAAVLLHGCRSTPDDSPATLLRASLARTERALQTHVSDPGRRERALEVLHAFAEVEEDFLAEAQVQRAQWTELNERRDATRSDYEPGLKALRGGRESFLYGAVDAWVELAALLTPEERHAIVLVQREEEQRWRAEFE